MSDYRQLDMQFVNMGLNLRDAPDKLQEGQWRRLTNIRSLSEGSITSRPGRLIVAGFNSGSPVHTLLKLNNSIISGSGTGLYRNGTAYPTVWNGSPLSWVKARSSQGEEKWLYLTDGSHMGMVAEDGSDIKWGITEPTEATVASVAGTGVLNSSAAGAIVYDWRYTYFNSRTGGESNPSPVTPGGAFVNQSAQVGCRASTDGQVDTIKLYRRGGLNGGSTWRLVTATANPGVDPITGQPNTVFFLDNQSDSQISLALALAIDNFVPFPSVKPDGTALYEAPVPYIWGPLDGKYIFGCGDPNRPGHVYWTNPGRPHSADVTNHVAVTSPDEPLMGGFIYAGTSYVWSREALYALDFGGPEAVPVFSPRKTYCGRGLSLPFAYTTGPLIWFFSKDGMYVCDGQSPAEPFTEANLRPLFSPQIENRDYSAPGAIKPINWPAFSITPPSPTSEVSRIFRLNYGGQYLHAHYIDTDEVSIHLVQHLPYNRWSNDVTAFPGYVEVLSYFDEEQPNTDLLIGLNNGLVALETGLFDYESTTKVACRARTGSLDFGMPQDLKELGNLILDCEVSNATIPTALDPSFIPTTGIAFTPVLNAETEDLTYQRVIGPQSSQLTRQKLPISFSASNNSEDPYCYSLALDFKWDGNATIYAATIQWRPDEPKITRWEFPPTTHGLAGYQQVRDIYLVMRGPSIITPTVEIDGVQYPLLNEFGSASFATTAAKAKYHLWCPPVKGKVFRWILNGSDVTGPGLLTGMRLYGAECEIRVKEFCTGLGYRIVSPFGGG